jgi:hypothetical protein
VGSVIVTCKLLLCQGTQWHVLPSIS